MASDLSAGFAVLETDARAPQDRDAYIPAALATDHEGRLIAIPLKSQGSSDFVGFSRAEALIVMPRGTSKAAGQVADILFL
jgi:molybdopterin biosynthesis enzyme